MALTADARVDASDINVDTNHETKTVMLKGRVPTAAQKTIAEEIADRRPSATAWSTTSRSAVTRHASYFNARTKRPMAMRR